jgi:putative ABC transport system substrate-binding protein
MNVRQWVIASLALSLLAAPLAADAQQVAKRPRIGLLRPESPPDPYTEAFQRGLREFGYLEGQNIVIEHRSAEGKADRLPALASELVRLKVDVIVAVSTPAALAAKQATTTIPIVIAYVGDPVGSGLVASLARPGGNITGVSALNVEYSVKWVELLKETIPTLSRVAVLSNPANPNHVALGREVQGAARALGVTCQVYEVRAPEELEGAFTAMTKARADGLLVLPYPFTFVHARRIADLATKSRLPAVFGFRESVEAGGLIAYAANAPDMFRRAAAYVDKILKGAKPADLPVEQPTKFELVINLKTAKALGLTIPQSILLRADEVIQ